MTVESIRKALRNHPWGSQFSELLVEMFDFLSTLANSGGRKVYTIELEALDIGKLNITPIIVTAEQLGSGPGKGVFVYGDSTQWEVDPDGGTFSVGFGNSVDLNNDNGDLVATASNTIEVSEKTKLLIPYTDTQKLEADRNLVLSTGAPINGGGANATLKITFEYKVIDL